ISSILGGGMINEGALVVNRSTISGITGSTGGGLVLNPESLTLVANSTISSNSSLWPDGTGGVAADGDLTMINATVARNEGTGLFAIGAFGQAIMLNSIVGQNTGANCAGSPGGDHNLDTDGTCGLTGEGDRSFAQAMLGPLADNGGPTPTHALLPGGCTGDACVPPSEAINTGSNTYCLMVDQRGAPRPLLDTCDMGAYEYGDADTDGIPDTTDNCPAIPNAEGQTADTDGDLAGDACDGPGSGNVDCSGPTNGVTAVDALKVLRYVAGLSVAQSEPCLEIGQPREPPATGIMGDVDCSGVANAVDALNILRAVAGLPVAKPEGCPEIKPP
ncbi:MAG TPA: choice-of-anchor Q domain-containing protein, partial [Dehalococcoidia bacterium]|nr:choice-of-anchor Q domain-containing protein [Dehalococcoidia bacterium]